MYSAFIHLLVSAVYFVFFISTNTVYAQSDSWENFSEKAKKYYAEAKELEKTDAFNIRLALKRAVSVEQPYKAFRWNNKYTKHHGELRLLDFIQPRRGRLCVNYKHTYFIGGGSPIEDEGMVCTNGRGRWDDIIVRATFPSVSTTDQFQVKPQRYTYAVIVWEVQDLLTRLNYNPGPVDGRYGQRTRLAIEHYQRDEGLSITGSVSQELVASLEQSVAILEALPSTTKADNLGPAPRGSSSPDEPRSLSQGGIASDLSSTESAKKEQAIDNSSIDSSLAGQTPLLTGTDSPDSKGLDLMSEDLPSGGKIVEQNVGVASLQRGDNDAEIEMSPSPPTQADTGGQKASADSPATDAVPGQNTALLVQDKSQISAVFKEIFDSIWSTVIIGFVLCVLVGIIVSRSLTSKVNSPTIGHAQMERATEEFDQSSKGTDRSVVSIQKQTRGYKQSEEDAQIKHVSAEGKEGMKDSRSIRKRSGEDTEEINPQAITELDEIIKEAEEILMLSDLEENFRGYIIKAVEDARTLIKKAFERDPVGGGFHEQTVKALREAKKLIEDALESDPSMVDTSQLRFKQKL